MGEERTGDAVAAPTPGELREVNARLLLVSLRQQEQAAEARRLAEALEYQALHDALTGLPNRALFTDRLRQTLLAARREGATFALLFLDLDRFKAVNDRLGHHAGDLLLQQVAARLRGALRESDTLARLYRDAFAALLPGTTRRRPRGSRGSSCARWPRPACSRASPSASRRVSGSRFTPRMGRMPTR